ncbi:hypothetical protein M9Y10_011706 [Tritrichomonas musculus]|uniref:Roadblock/LAMTOR2 domain-containing protein n=1 Tax=Tritrichomonas musculus TaxID=1915356 RepID=A0ABR2IL62_9EUKA
MTKLLNIDNTQTFLKTFVEENEAVLAFISTLEGGIICSTELNKARMVVEALSLFWQKFLNPQWKRICLEWESSYIVLINTGNWVFGLQYSDPNPMTIGLLRMKAKICADHIKSQLG